MIQNKRLHARNGQQRQGAASDQPDSAQGTQLYHTQVLHTRSTTIAVA